MRIEEDEAMSESRSERLARRFGAHAEVSRRQELVPARNGVGQHIAHYATTACGRELSTTLVTKRADRVKCPDCVALMEPS